MATTPHAGSSVADVVQYQRALHRIRTDFLEMPGMRLTPEQVQRLSAVDGTTCQAILDELVQARFLRVGPDRRYARVADAEQTHRPGLRVSR